MVYIHSHNDIHIMTREGKHLIISSINQLDTSLLLNYRSCQQAVGYIEKMGACLIFEGNIVHLSVSSKASRIYLIDKDR